MLSWSDTASRTISSCRPTARDGTIRKVSSTAPIEESHPTNYDIILVMLSKKDRFLQYVGKYSPASQIMRFMHLLDTNQKDLANEVVHYFLDLALKNNLVGCYKTIVNKLNVGA